MYKEIQPGQLYTDDAGNVYVGVGMSQCGGGYYHVLNIYNGCLWDTRIPGETFKEMVGDLVVEGER